jgi:CubicO group peptidase (beta-lactamase class C family)
MMIRRAVPVLACVVMAALAISAVSGETIGGSQSREASIDALFSRWGASTPGCAVGVSMAGRPVVQKAYGMADLEHDARNRPDTIFEAGSVSKQFTAAAVLLLARDGKLSLDDPVRKHVPELPDYGVPLTIRHMLHHTSGLRDWGNVAAIAGWPRTSRVHTHAHVLDIVSRQRALNFTPGTEWSYSNTGYNLAAVLVSRVAGTSFAEFSRQRLFEPLGMTSTSWRDDHTRIIKGRAVAYAPSQAGFRLQMPFENVHGNGGLLTTVGDLMRWNENFVQPKVGDAAFVRQQQEPGRFNDGRAHDYAFGLRVGRYKGVREIGHSGSTAGYRAHLSYYPDQRLSVAVLCNAGSANATQYARATADLYLGEHFTASGPAERARAAHRLSDAELKAVQGLYRRTDTGEPLSIVADGKVVRVQRGPELVALSATKFTAAGGSPTLEIVGGGLTVTDEFGTVHAYERAKEVQATAETLADFHGNYTSEEAEAAVAVETMRGILSDGREMLVMRRRPDQLMPLTPVYADAFQAAIGLVRFHRDDAGRVTGFSVSQDRVWDLRFTRESGPAGRDASADR